MSRPTKEEAAQWARTLDGVAADVLDWTRLDAHALACFLRRVAENLTSAAPQRAERRKPTLGPVPSEWLPDPDDVPGCNDGYPE